MDYLPLFIKLQGRRVLVVGGGKVATRKIELLLRAGALPLVVAPRATARVQELHHAGQLEWQPREFAARDVADVWLVIAAVANTAIRNRVLAAAHARNLHVNVVDQAARSDAIVPAIVDRSPLQIAISSGGAAPVLARRLRAQLERWLPLSTGLLAAFVARHRRRIRQVIANPVQRRHFHEQLADGPIAASVSAGRPEQAEQLLQRALNTAALRGAAGKGLVSLVGAGPGDPDLLTVKAVRRLQQADVIVHDGLVGEQILDFARRDAERINVAKRAHAASVSQATINALLRDHALRGHNVVRLKGGDPFIFGRGGEELMYLRRWGIPYEVVPGITAAVACAAYAGIPLTYRGQADAVSLVTGHCISAAVRTDWAELARSRHTLALYMSVGEVARIQHEMLAHGCAAATPVAFVENGTQAEQRVITGRLDELAELAECAALASPAMVFIGATAAHAETLHWFGAAPQRSEDIRAQQTTVKRTGELRS